MQHVQRTPQPAAPRQVRGSLGESEAFCRDLTQLALEGRFVRYQLRSAVNDQLLALLTKMDKPTVVLTGKPGVGKSCNVYAFVDQLVHGANVPADLRGMRVLELQVAEFLSGADAGELARRTTALCRNAAAAGRGVLLFIDEAHTLVDARIGALSIGEILKPSLARGEFCCIAATTDAGYRSSFEADDALARRFQRVDVPEPDEDETIAILQKSAPGLARKHGALVTAEDVTRAVRMGRRYARHRVNPDKTNDLIDEAMALQRVTFATNPTARADFAQRTQQQWATAVRVGDEAEAERNGAISAALLQGGMPFDSRFLGEVIHRWTGLPTEVLGGQTEALSSLAERVKGRVVGQDAAVNRLVGAVVRGITGTGRRCGPLASAFLAGSTGVGKTETARVIASEILGSEDAMLRIDGSEFSESHSLSRLIGSPPGYVGFTDGGDLTSFVRDHPFGVLVFDEVEKAHRSVQDLFLQILEEGELQDGRGVRVDFSGQVVLFTSNVDVERSASSAIGFGGGSTRATGSADDERSARERLATHLRPELVNRFDLVLPYRQLTKADIRNIVQLLATDFTRRMRDERRLDVVLEDALLERVASEAFNPAWGGREVRRAFDRLVTQEIASWIVENPGASGCRIIVSEPAPRPL